VENGGKPLYPLYNDEFLLERLRLLATDSMTNARVKKTVQSLFYGWSAELQGRRGYDKLSQLYRQLPQRTRKPASKPQPKYLSNDPEDMEDDSEEESGRSHEHRRTSSVEASSRRVSHSRTSSVEMTSPKHEQRRKSKPKKQQTVVKIDLVKEKPNIKETLAESGTAATNLTNALQLINREKELATDNNRATVCFNQCRALRRRVLRYIHSIESEEFIGALIHANEELVAALRLYDTMSHPPDEDSDSEYENDDWKIESGVRNMNVNEDDDTTRASVSRKVPPPVLPKPVSLKGKPVAEADEEEELDPFADSHVVETLPKHTPIW
jgi:hypothetical protein